MGRRKKSDIAVELQQSLEYDDGSVVKKEVIDKSTLKAPINMWKPKSKYDLYITPDVQECTIEFDRLFGVAKLSCYNKFAVKKDSYSNQLPTICKYINFFIHEYDTEKELIMIYLNIKASIDNIEEKLPIGTGDYFEGEQDYDKFIDYVYEMMFTPTIIEKIHRLVEDNYLDDIESDDGSKKYATKEKKHLESLEFTNEHIKTLLKISFGIKMMTPVVFHYIGKNKIIVNKTTSHLFRAFKELFNIFSDTCNMYNKLFVYVKTKVMENKSNNERMYSQREILGTDEYSVIHKFTRVVLISENIVKFKFNENWNKETKKYKENITGFIKTIF